MHPQVLGELADEGDKPLENISDYLRIHDCPVKFILMKNGKLPHLWRQYEPVILNSVPRQVIGQILLEIFLRHMKIKRWLVPEKMASLRANYARKFSWSSVTGLELW